MVVRISKNLKMKSLLLASRSRTSFSHQMGAIKQEVGLGDSMGPDFVVFRFDSSRMVPTVSGCLHFSNVSLLLSYEKSVDVSMDSCLLDDQVDHNRGINFL